MAWLNEEERALGKGRFAPYSDFRMGVREPNTVTPDVPKFKPQTGEYDNILDSTNRFYATYERSELQRAETAAKNQQDAMLNDYAMRLNDLRTQFTNGQIETVELDRRERQLANKYMQAGVSASELASIRSQFGGKGAQAALDAAMKKQQENIQDREKKSVEALIKENPSWEHLTYSEALAKANQAEIYRKEFERMSVIYLDPHLSPETKQMYQQQAEQSAAGMIYFKTMNALDNYAYENPTAELTPDVYLGLENQATADVMRLGYSENEARFWARKALSGVKAFADNRFGQVTNREKLLDTQNSILKHNYDSIILNNAPLAAISTRLGQSGPTFLATAGTVELREELENIVNATKAAQAAQSIANGGDRNIKPYQDSQDAAGAVNLLSITLQGDMQTFLPDAAGGIYLVGSRNFNNVNYDMSGSGVAGMSTDDRTMALRNAEKWKDPLATIDGWKDVEEGLMQLCKGEKMCFTAGQKVLRAYSDPTNEFSQASQFLQNSVINGNLRMGNDGTLKIAESSGILDRTGELFYQRQYLDNLEKINKVLLQEPDVNARKYILRTLYGADIQDLGLTPEMEPTVISGAVSSSLEGVGVIADVKEKYENAKQNLIKRGVDKILPEPVKDYYQNVNSKIEQGINILLNPETAARGLTEVTETAGSKISDIINKAKEVVAGNELKEQTPKQISEDRATFKNLWQAAFPFIEQSKDNEEVVKDIRDAFVSLQKNKRDLEYLYKRQAGFTDSTTGKQVKEDWGQEINRLTEENQKYEKIIRDGVKKITPGYVEEAEETMQEDVKITPEHSSMVDTYSNQFGVDPNIVKRMLFKESKGKRDAESPAGAKGLMQLMPKTFEEVKKELKLPKDADIYDEETNIKAGCYYFAKMMRQFKQDVNKALAAYNWGPGNVSEAVREYGDDWFEGARDLGITVRDPKTGKKVKRYLPKETQDYVSDLGQSYV